MVVQIRDGSTYFTPMTRVPRFPTDADVPDRIRRTMSAIRATETKPEKALRSALHGRGFRFRKNLQTLPGRPDIALTRRHKAIFVHGCFWHQHRGCRHAKFPKTRPEYWSPKLERVQARDKANIADLRQKGWQTLVVWECELDANPRKVLEQVISFLEGARSAGF
jgi:DNA mismatch endonuclease (patch repair protein)